MTTSDWEARPRATTAPAIAATVRTIARTVDCQRCGARTGEPCKRPGGGRARDPHRTRIRTAHQEDR